VGSVHFLFVFDMVTWAACEWGQNATRELSPNLSAFRIWIVTWLLDAIKIHARARDHLIPFSSSASPSCAAAASIAAPRWPPLPCALRRPAPPASPAAALPPAAAACRGHLLLPGRAPPPPSQGEEEEEESISKKMLIYILKNIEFIF
jgi:hypothetical protein